MDKIIKKTFIFCIPNDDSKNILHYLDFIDNNVIAVPFEVFKDINVLCYDLFFDGYQVALSFIDDNSNLYCCDVYYFISNNFQHNDNPQFTKIFFDKVGKLPSKKINRVVGEKLQLKKILGLCYGLCVLISNDNCVYLWRVWDDFFYDHLQFTNEVIVKTCDEKRKKLLLISKNEIIKCNLKFTTDKYRKCKWSLSDTKHFNKVYKYTNNIQDIFIDYKKNFRETFYVLTENGDLIQDLKTLSTDKCLTTGVHKIVTSFNSDEAILIYNNGDTLMLSNKLCYTLNFQKVKNVWLYVDGIIVQDFDNYLYFLGITNNKIYYYNESSELLPVQIKDNYVNIKPSFENKI